MAGPHVVGAVALLISANPALRGNVEALEQIIRDTANRTMPNPPGSDACGGTQYNVVPNQIYGWGRLDALDAVTQAMEPMYAFTGKSVDAATQQPVKAHIELRQGAVIVALSESNGNSGAFKMSVAGGTYDIVATSPGYQTIQRTVTFDSNQRAALRFQQ
jgi:hypothetical protein